MIINSNIDAMKSFRSLNNNTRKMDKNMEKLSSGMKINRAADDSAGLSISTKMRAQIRGLAQDERNIDDGVSMFNVAEGGMAQIENMIHRMRELSIQSANDTNTDDDRQKMQKEIEQLIEGIDKISSDTEYNTHKVLLGEVDTRSRYILLGGLLSGQMGTLRSAGNNWATAITSLSEFSITDVTSLITPPPALVTTNQFSIDGHIDANFPIYPGFSQYSDFGEFLQKMNSSNPKDAQFLVDSLADAMTAGLRAVDPNGTYPDVTGLVMGSGNNLRIGFIVGDGTDYGIRFGGCTSIPIASIGHNYLHNTFGASQSSLNLEISGTSKGYTIQVGANTAQNVMLDIPSMIPSVVGHPPRTIDKVSITTQVDANVSIALCDKALEYVNNARTLMGAHVNRLESAKSGVNNYHENISAAESRIRDTNMSKEMTEQVKNNILMQSATAMLAQANQRPENILQILR